MASNVPVYEMRNHLKAAYNHGPKWCLKVDKMPDDQVIVVFNRLRRTGRVKGV